jgi:pimeloyl-ACP methyl ester carboxylesterase/predicted amino acid-binding ACT domain protein
MATTTPGTRTAGLEWRTLEVEGRPASCAVGGRGLPVVFLHGWGLGPRAYQRALHELVRRGCSVYAPALPGFGGTAHLPSRRRTIDGYASWVDAFLDAVGLDVPALVVGHSFGGGVAIGLAHRAPARVRHLVLINSVGSPARSKGPALAEHSPDQPSWRYGLQFSRELFWSRDGYRLMLAIREDVIRNMFGNPWAQYEVGTMARRVDLTPELAELRRREVPILVLWSDGDGVLPLTAFDTLCAAIGTDGRVLKGGHSWLLVQPQAFSEVLDNLVRVQVAEHESMGVRTSTAELRSLLGRTTIPEPVVSQLLAAASPLWMMSERPSVLAADLALCHPALAGEVRAVVRPMDDPATFRLSVVATDRPGFLADTAAVLAAEGLTVLSASVATWTDVALHSLTVRAPDGAVPGWDAVGVRLRAGPGGAPTGRFTPTGRATVTVGGGQPGGSMVTVTAPDAIGLLEAISRWFADHRVSVEAAEIATHDGVATDRFLVTGEFDPADLAAQLSADPRSPWSWLPRCGCLRRA